MCVIDKFDDLWIKHIKEILSTLNYEHEIGTYECVIIMISWWLGIINEKEIV